MRVGSLWVHEDENKKKQISGEISAEAGINLAAGQKLSCKLVRNEKKQRGDRFPDYYIEAWFQKGKTTASTQNTIQESGAGEDIEF